MTNNARAAFIRSQTTHFCSLTLIFIFSRKVLNILKQANSELQLSCMSAAALLPRPTSGEQQQQSLAFSPETSQVG
jgi:hypothetical protein